MAVQNHLELLHALEQSAFDTVLGTTESDDIEFKKAPYQLEQPREKWELAKDVAALANQRGGVIIIGFRTERLQNQLLDVAIEHRAIPKNLVNWDSYRSIIGAWIRPPIEGLAGRWFPADQGADRGVFALIIPSQPDHSKYFVVSEMVAENGSFPGAVGVPVRQGDAVTWLRPDFIQSLLREALWWRKMGPTIVNAVTPNSAMRAVEDRIAERVIEVEKATTWEETPFLALHAIPALPLICPDDFYSDAGLKGHLASPNVLRRGGFHIRTYAEPEVRSDGSLLCATNRRILWLSPDGFFTAAATADEEFLGRDRGRAADLPIVVNPKAAAEYVLEFCRFVHSELKPRSQATWNLWLSIVGFDRKGGIVLKTRDQYTPKEVRADRRIPSGASSGADAYLLMAEFYALFAAPLDDIPYVIDHQISEEAILAAT